MSGTERGEFSVSNSKNDHRFFFFFLPRRTQIRLTDFTVEPARPQQGRVQGVGSVGGHDHLDSVEGVEAVHLVQQLTRPKQKKGPSVTPALRQQCGPDAVS